MLRLIYTSAQVPGFDRLAFEQLCEQASRNNRKLGVTGMLLCNGIEFMLDGAKDRNGNPFDVSVQELKARGVEFRLCNNTLVQRKIDRARVVAEADIVPSGVAEAARLQAREGFVYLRP